jgi:formate hydrogenlyase subunit 3/multisubunit Na+/H+ antiporter MnhD subunit
MDSISGIPAHPLFVHVPAVLLPLGAIGVAVMLARRAWFERYRWAVLVVTGLGMIGAILAASSGEELEETVLRGEGAEAARRISEHAEAGETARLFAIIFFVVLVVAVVLPIVLQRRARPEQGRSASPTWLRPVLAVLLAASAVASVVTVIDAGHSGASSVWGEVTGGD